MARKRSRRKGPSPTFAHYAAPAAFLVAATIAILLVRSALQHDPARHDSTTSPPVLTTSTTTRATTTSRTTTAGSGPRYYVVEAGDTFGTIATKAGTTVAEIERLNPGIASTSLHIGQQIRVG